MARPKATDLTLWNRFCKQILFADNNDCWIWFGALANSGYGVLNWGGKVRTVHRISWEFWNGMIPEDLDVLHHCDNRRCLRPDHLFLGTNQDNIDDMVMKGRQRKSTFLTYAGETLHLAEWARRTGLKHVTISMRLKNGWSLDQALTIPVKRPNYLVRT